MYRYNKLSYFQYARCQILVVHLQCELFWSVGIPIVAGCSFSCCPSGLPTGTRLIDDEHKHGWRTLMYS